MAPPPRGRLLATVMAIGLAAALAGGCARSAERNAVHRAGTDQKVRVSLGSGPMDELVILRSTGGGFVVSGLCLFPESTRVVVALYDSTGRLLTRTQPSVENAEFLSRPLVSDSGAPWPVGRYQVELSAEFAPGAQPPGVLRAFGDGRRFSGEGMTRTRQGQAAYLRRLEVVL